MFQRSAEELDRVPISENITIFCKFNPFLLFSFFLGPWFHVSLRRVQSKFCLVKMQVTLASKLHFCGVQAA